MSTEYQGYTVECRHTVAFSWPDVHWPPRWFLVGLYCFSSQSASLTSLCITVSLVHPPLAHWPPCCWNMPNSPFFTTSVLTFLSSRVLPTPPFPCALSFLSLLIKWHLTIEFHWLPSIKANTTSYSAVMPHPILLLTLIYFPPLLLLSPEILHIYLFLLLLSVSQNQTQAF